jgi:hypothetical protein
MHAVMMMGIAVDAIVVMRTTTPTRTTTTRRCRRARLSL